MFGLDLSKSSFRLVVEGKDSKTTVTTKALQFSHVHDHFINLFKTKCAKRNFAWRFIRQYWILPLIHKGNKWVFIFSVSTWKACVQVVQLKSQKWQTPSRVQIERKCVCTFSLQRCCCVTQCWQKRHTIPHLARGRGQSGRESGRASKRERGRERWALVQGLVLH